MSYTWFTDIYNITYTYSISAHSNFTYHWRAEQNGIYWYHSHNAIQRLDGLFGGIFIYEKGTQSRLNPFYIQ